MNDLLSLGGRNYLFIYADIVLKLVIIKEENGF